MRVWPKHWHPETWICSMRGHDAPATGAEVVGPLDAMLGLVTPDGHRLARCLRCDCWVPHVAPFGSSIRFAELPPFNQLGKPRRGHALREAIVMRLIAINKATHALAFSLIALALMLTRINLFRMQTSAQAVLDFLNRRVGDTGQGDSRSWLEDKLEELLNMKSHTIALLLALALTYAVVEWAEAVGLWLERRWAEYLTVIATAGFLPLEIHELSKRVTALRVLALVTNLALLVWLVRNKRLFGLRGGRRAMERDLETDWPSVLESPTPAFGRTTP
jgi:uncharacterized membrane protein (DUF2068 family)